VFLFNIYEDQHVTMRKQERKEKVKRSSLEKEQSKTKQKKK